VNVPSRSNRKLFLASALVILAGIGLFLMFLFVSLAVVLPQQPPVYRALVIGAFAAPLLLLASWTLRDTSILWQIPLQSCAAATATVGAVALVTLAFNDWHLLFGSIDTKAALSLVTGFALGWLMRQLQARLLREQDA
jgi:hypothetical protein